MISDKQAEILSILVCYGEMRLRYDGMYLDNGEKVDGRSLMGLIRRKLLRPSAYNTMPSVGHISSPIFFDDGITEKGIAELDAYLSLLPGYGKPDWALSAERQLITRSKQENVQKLDSKEVK